MTINNEEIEWADKIKYLGFFFQSGSSLTVDLSDCRKKFFATANKILCKAKFCDEIVKLTLVESYCLPILTYAIESVPVNKSQLTQMNIWWNSIYRTTFGYNKWESVRELIW